MIASLEAQSSRSWELILVDSGSADVEYLDAFTDRGAVVKLGSNLGFGASCNKAVELARGSTLLFLNPDVRLETDTLAVLVDAMDRDGAAVIAPLLVDNAGTAAISGGIVPADPLTSRLPTRRSTRPESFVTGACFLVKAAAFHEVGGFDERFFLFCEEIDLQLRLQAVGHRVELCAETIAHHAGGAGSGRVDPDWRTVQHFASHSLFSMKHHSKAGGLITLIYNIVRTLRLTSDRPRGLRTFGRALTRGLRAAGSQ
jgi:GT2 family glycosyltransferase